MGAFPNLSRNVPFCPRLSSFVLLGARNGEKSGQKRTNGDKPGHFGTNWETPPFSIYPHLAALNFLEIEGRKSAKYFAKFLPRSSPMSANIFARISLSEKIAPNFRGNLKGWFPKGWFWRMFPRNENRNEGTFAKTTLLRNRPFISQ